VISKRITAKALIERIEQLEKQLAMTQRGMQSICKHSIVPGPVTRADNTSLGVCEYCGYVDYSAVYHTTAPVYEEVSDLTSDE
jgi:hypothetical protein